MNFFGRVRELSKRLLDWLGLFTILSILATVVSVWWYQENDRRLNAQWYVDDVAWNEQIIGQLTELRDEQTSQRILIDELVRDLGLSARDARDERQRIIDAIYEGLVDINFRIGEHQGRHRGVTIEPAQDR